MAQEVTEQQPACNEMKRQIRQCNSEKGLCLIAVVQFSTELCKIGSMIWPLLSATSLTEEGNSPLPT